MKETALTEDDDVVADTVSASPPLKLPSVKKRRCCRRQNDVNVSRYFKGRKKPSKPPFVLTGRVVKWTPPKSPYNLIQVCGP